MEAIMKMGSQHGITAAGLIVLALLIASFAFGWYRGLVREILSLTYVIIVFVLVWVINPRVDSFLQNNTKLYTTVETQSRKAVESVTSQLGISALSSPESIVEQLQIPDFMKKQLLENNNPQGYQALDVSGFTEYLTVFLSRKICSGISFVISWIIAAIVVKLLSLLLESVMKLPLLNEANKLGGGIIGGVKGIFLVWLVMLLLTVFCNAEFGRKALETIKKDVILAFLYEKDLLIRIFM